MDNHFVTDTIVNLENAESVKIHGYALIDAASDKVTIDLASLKHANSVTIAVLCAWHRYAARRDISAVFINLDEELRNIIVLSGLQDVLLLNESTNP
jgi:anti-anti-sigma regulatory factor